MVVVMVRAIKYRENTLTRDAVPQDQIEILARDWIESAVAEFRSMRMERQRFLAPPEEQRPG
jgi:hypothetical protein